MVKVCAADCQSEQDKTSVGNWIKLIFVPSISIEQDPITALHRASRDGSLAAVKGILPHCTDYSRSWFGFLLPKGPAINLKDDVSVSWMLS